MVGCLQVVDIHIEQRDSFETSIRMLEEEGGSPVVGFIILDGGRCAIGFQENVITHGQCKIASSLDGVRMSRRNSWTDDRISTPTCKRTVSVKMIDSECSAVLDS